MPIRMNTVKKTENTSYLQGFQITVILIHGCWKCKLLQPLWKIYIYIYLCVYIYIYISLSIYIYKFFFAQLSESVPSDSNKCHHYLFEHYWSKSYFTVELIKLCIFYAPSQWRKWQPTPVFLLEKSHGWRSLVGYSPRGRKESDTTEQLRFLFTFMYLLGLTEFIDHLAYLV